MCPFFIAYTTSENGELMKSTADKIAERMYELNITQADIKRATGAGKATISSWINGYTKPSSLYISKLATCLRCTPNWLLANDDQKNNIYETAENPFIECQSKGMTPIISWTIAANFSGNIPTIIDPIVDWTPRLPHLSEQAFGLIIQGRSMWPEFKPKDIIYVEPKVVLTDLKDGDLIIVRDNDNKQANFKQVIIGEDKSDLYLKTINPDWPHQSMQPMADFTLIGIVDSKLVKYR